MNTINEKLLESKDECKDRHLQQRKRNYEKEPGGNFKPKSISEINSLDGCNILEDREINSAYLNSRAEVEKNGQGEKKGT